MYCLSSNLNCLLAFEFVFFVQASKADIFHVNKAKTGNLNPLIGDLNNMYFIIYYYYGLYYTDGNREEFFTFSTVRHLTCVFSIWG